MRKAAAELPHFILSGGVLSVGRRRVIFDCWPGVAELADAPDSKSGGRKAVWVRPPPPGPLLYLRPGPRRVQFQLAFVNSNTAQSAGIAKGRAVPHVTKPLLYLSFD